MSKKAPKRPAQKTTERRRETVGPTEGGSFVITDAKSEEKRDDG